MRRSRWPAAFKVSQWNRLIKKNYKDGNLRDSSKHFLLRLSKEWNSVNVHRGRERKGRARVRSVSLTPRQRSTGQLRLAAASHRSDVSIIYWILWFRHWPAGGSTCAEEFTICNDLDDSRIGRSCTFINSFIYSLFVNRGAAALRVRYILINGAWQFQVCSPLLRILSSSTSVCPLGIFLFKTWAERRNMASTAEPFNSAIWSSRSRDRKPARAEHLRVSSSFSFLFFF